MTARGNHTTASKRERRWQGNDSVRTPQALFDQLNEEFGFTLDGCCHAFSALCERYFTPSDNALWQDWSSETVWINPPYSDITPWVRKAYEATFLGTTTVMLLPARTSTGWWHDFVLPYAEIRYIRGRISFRDTKEQAPFDSVIVVFRPAERPESYGPMFEEVHE